MAYASNRVNSATGLLAPGVALELQNLDASIALSIAPGGSAGVSIFQDGSLTNSLKLTLASGAATFKDFGANTVDAFTLDTTNTKTSGLIFNVKNNGTSKFKVDTNNITVNGTLTLTTGNVVAAKFISPQDGNTTMTVEGRQPTPTAGSESVWLQPSSTIAAAATNYIVGINRGHDSPLVARFSSDGGLKLNVEGTGGVLSLGGSEYISASSGSMTFMDAAAAGTDGHIIDSVNDRTLATQNHLNIKSAGVSIFTFSGTTTNAKFAMPGGVSIQNGGANFSTVSCSGVNAPNSNASLQCLSRGGANVLSLGNDNTVSDAQKVVRWVKSSTTELGSINGSGKFTFTTGSAGVSGTATLVGGTVTVSTTAVLTGSLIFVTHNTPGGTIGILSAPVASISNATSFVINSSSGTDTSTVNWWVIN